MEVGSIISFAGSTLPDGYLVCDGSAVSRDTYSELFEIIGTTYGVGNGSSTFNLPNLVNRIAMGSSSSYALGTSGGEESHALLSGEIAEHSHVIPSHGHANDIVAKTPSLSHTITQPTAKYTMLNGGAQDRWRGSATSVYNGRTGATMSRSTNVGVANHAAADCTMSGGITDCAAMDTTSVGSSTAHNNMMPYLSLTYLIRYEPEIKAERMLIFNGCMPCAPSGAYLKGRKG